MVILEYTPEPEAEEPYFEIDGTTGDLIALKQLDYTVDPHRYVVDVTATEHVSGFTTTQQVCFLSTIYQIFIDMFCTFSNICNEQLKVFFNKNFIHLKDGTDAG